MSDKLRWRYGDTNPVSAAVLSATVIEIGDLLWQDVYTAMPASQMVIPNAVNAEDLRCRFANQFLGVATHRSQSGETASIRVATTGVFEFNCPSGTFELGDLIGVAVLVADTQNQQVDKVSYPVLAIARVAKREPVATSAVLIDIRSTVMTGGIIGR